MAVVADEAENEAPKIKPKRKIIKNKNPKDY